MITAGIANSIAVSTLKTVLGHIYFAIRDPIALGGMTRGGVTPYWARTERPAWYREMTGEPQGSREGE